MEKARVNSTEEQLLRQLNDDRIRAYAPAIAFSVTVLVFGILGNAISVTFYGFKVPRTSTNIIITVLAAVDLITCVVLSDGIIELCLNVTFKSVGGCKAMYFFNHSLVLISGFMLLLLTVDRFRKVCRPFAWQFSMFTLKISFASIVTLSVLSSVRDLVIIDVVRVNVTYDGRNIRAYYCTHSRAKSLANTVRAFQYIDLLYLIVLVVSTAILYSCIAKKLWKSRKKLKQHYRQTGINELDASGREASNSLEIDTDTKNNMTLKEDQVSTNDIKLAGSDTFHKDSVVKAETRSCKSGSLFQMDKGKSAEMTNMAQGNKLREKNCSNNQLAGSVYNTADLGKREQGVSDSNIEKKHSKVINMEDETDIDRGSGFVPNKDFRRLTRRLPESRNIERKVTLMMFTINAAFLVSFIPYFIVNLWIKQQKNSSAQEFNAGIQIALRSYMLNNAINPYIIGFFNLHFRKFVKSLLCDWRIFSRQ